MKSKYSENFDRYFPSFFIFISFYLLSKSYIFWICPIFAAFSPPPPPKKKYGG